MPTLPVNEPEPAPSPERSPGLAILVLVAALTLPLPAAAGVRPAYGGEVRVALPAAPRITDPALATDPGDLLLVRAIHATPLELDADGRLSPGLLEEVPAPEAGGRAFRLRLRAGLRFSDGTPIAASDVAAAFVRLLAREGPAPNAWIALPVLGAEAFQAGRAATLAGVQVLSDRELLVTLASAMPEWPWALAAPAAAVVSRGGAGAGPFVLQGLDGAGARLAANGLHWRGRPFADRLTVKGADPRAAARALSGGDLELVLRPEAVPGATATAPSPPLLATYAVVNWRRLGSGAERVRRVLGALDRAELGKLYARGPSAPTSTLVPQPVLAGPAAAPASPSAPGAPGIPGQARLVLLAAADVPDQRALAERLQVKLFDAGVRAAAELEGGGRFAARLAAEDFDVALVPVQVTALAPALAGGQVALATRGPGAARRAMTELAGLPAAAAAPRAERLTRTLDLVPLFSTGVRASAGPALQGLRIRADGAIDLGDLWLLRREGP
ncbi:MAG TPA: ABC transporter substrate-binding protein [Anaeromyxobacter sp.]|nr:ABC transporter substrate-binding protein [Anaeromyxobacter sp.]